ncbi:GTP-binding protein 10, partial [Microtus ochrogaster]
SVADLPGFVEGAHINKGIGHKFLKHLEQTRQLLFVVDILGFQLSSVTPYRTPFETIIPFTEKLELYKEELQIKPALLAVNKMDLPDAQVKLDELMKQLQNPAGKASFTSLFLGTSCITECWGIFGEGVKVLRQGFL